MTTTTIPSTHQPTRVRYGVMGFMCALSFITFLDRACWGTVAPTIKVEFGLSNTQLGWIAWAFAFAYGLFEIPSGWLGDTFGPRKTLIRIVLWWSLFTVLTGCIFPGSGGEHLWVPFALFMAVRFLFGMGEAGAYPNMVRSLHNWIPFRERAAANGALGTAGRFAGAVTPFIVFALMYTTVESGGAAVTHWRHVFWIFGGIGTLWCLGCYFWYRDNPSEMPAVNQAEIALIQKGEDHSHDKPRVPWLRLLSPNLLALYGAYALGAYGWYFNITYLPLFLQEYHGMKRGQVFSSQYWEFSLLTGAPLLLGGVSCLVGGMMSDALIQKTGNRKWGRRIFGVTGHGLCAVCYFIALLYMDNPWIFVGMITLASMWNDFTMGTAWASCIDIGRRFSGVVGGAMNSAGHLAGSLAGVFTGRILDLMNTPAPVAAASEIALLGGSGPAAPLMTAASYVTVRTEGIHAGWFLNFAIFTGVYVVATFLWLFFDPTKTIDPGAPEKSAQVS